MKKYKQQHNATPLGKALRKLMLKERWSCLELSRYLGISNSEAWAWVWENRLPYAHTYLRLVTLFPELAKAYPHVPLDVLKLSTDAEKFGAWVRAEREKRKLSQRDLNYLAGIGNVNDIENGVNNAKGRKTIKMQTLDRLCAVLCGDFRPAEILPQRITELKLKYLKLIAQGLPDSAIGEIMHVSQDTAKNARLKICRALGARNSVQAVAVAVGLGLMPLEDYAEAAKAAVDRRNENDAWKSREMMNR